MKTCPHCRFLVDPDATTCSICSAELPAPRAVAPAGGAAFVAPGQGAAVDATTSAPFTAAPSGQPVPSMPPPFPGTPFPGTPYPGTASPGAPAHVGPPPKRGTSTAKVLVIVGVLCLVPVIGLVAIITLLGTTTESELVAEELFWTTYDEPEGRYSVLMPGIADEHDVEMPDVYGAPGALESAVVENPNFLVTVARTPEIVPPGTNFDTIPFSPSAAAQGVEDMGLVDAELTSHHVVEGTDGTAMAMELRGTVDGRESIFLSRVVIGGSDLYELNVLGPVESEDDLRAMHDRLVGSFELG